MAEALLVVAILSGGLVLWFGLREANVRICSRSLFRDYPHPDRRQTRQRLRRAFDRGAASLFDWNVRRRG